MKKIPSLFKRDYEGNRQVYNEVVEGCEWVLNGEGIATRKYDGTACMVKDGKLYKRHDAKRGKKPPKGAIPCEPEPNEHTGHWPHWVLVDKNKPEDKYFIEAFQGDEDNGTYELCGPKVQGNPEGFANHILLLHGLIKYNDCPRDFNGIRDFLKYANTEGIVFHHPDGRMCKIKKKDFGLKR